MRRKPPSVETRLTLRIRQSSFLKKKGRGRGCASEGSRAGASASERFRLDERSLSRREADNRPSENGKTRARYPPEVDQLARVTENKTAPRQPRSKYRTSNRYSLYRVSSFVGRFLDASWTLEDAFFCIKDPTMRRTRTRANDLAEEKQVESDSQSSL